MIHPRYWPQLLPLNQDRTEVRILSAVLTGFFICHLMEPALYAATVDESILARVVDLSGYPPAVLFVFFACAAAVVPHFVSLLCMPRFLNCRLPRVLACYGALVAALLWFYLANLALPLDAGPLSYIYAGRALMNLFVGAVFGFSLNSQQLRELLHVPSSPT